jgi:single-strand DNA-binding protein
VNDLNTFAITGRLVRDPELKSIPSGTALCELSVAVNESVKKNDEWTQYAHYFDVVVWGRQGESCAQYLAKGRQVAIKGTLRQNRWETQEGQKRSKVVLVAERVVFIGSKPEGQQTAQAPTSESDPYGDDASIPF